MKKRTQLINKITKIGIFTALSVVLYYVSFPLPFVPSFLKVNFSMLPIILVAFMYGPLEGSIVVMIRFLLKIPFSHTVMVGEIGDLIIGLITIIPTSLIYQMNRSKKGGVIALILSFVLWVVTGTLSNLITIPLYLKLLFKNNTQKLVEMMQIIPGINVENYLSKYLIYGALPFNLLLAFVVCMVTFFLYKYVSNIFKHDFFKDNPKPKMLVMIDSFKGTLTSKQANEIVKEAWKHKYIIDTLPISDGGEGFLETVQAILKIPFFTSSTFDALHREKMARYLYDEKNQTAYLELAECCGIAKLKKEELSCFEASSYGLGYLMNFVINNHLVKKMYVGIGGSASSDGGSGMLEALGAEFYDENDEIITRLNNEKLSKIKKIRVGKIKTKWQNIEVMVLTDVQNPLLGPNGAVQIFAPQKGATANDLVKMEENMKVYFDLINTQVFSNTTFNENGEGAAGGVGFAFNRIIRAKLTSGINTLLEMINFEQLSQKYDLIITGEGAIDEQTLQGKVISGILTYKPKRLIMVAGISKIKIENYEIYTVVPEICDLETSLKDPIQNFKKLIEKLPL